MHRFLGNVLQHPEREEHFDKFITWLHENGVDTSCVSIKQFHEGYGLQANKDVEVCKLPNNHLVLYILMRFKCVVIILIRVHQLDFTNILDG